jgi:hypothetical protein
MCRRSYGVDYGGLRISNANTQADLPYLAPKWDQGYIPEGFSKRISFHEAYPVSATRYVGAR